MASNDYAVVVGINYYSCLDPLNGPENDALDFKKWLISPEGGALPTDGHTIQLVLSRDYEQVTKGDFINQEPTLQKVLNAFDNIMEQVSTSPGRRLYIFMAGHGITPQNDMDEVALMMANASLQRTYTIPGRKYVQWFREAALFEEVVLFMDCCRDNVPYAPLHGPYWRTQVREDAVNVKCYLGFATKWSQKSQEIPFDVQGKKRYMGLFSHAVISILNSGRLTGNQLKELVINYMQLLAPDGLDQDPQLIPDPSCDIVFSENAKPVEKSIVPFKISFNPDRVGTQMVIARVEDGRMKNYCGPHIATEQTWDVELPWGFYVIQERGSNEIQMLQAIGTETQNVKF